MVKSDRLSNIYLVSPLVKQTNIVAALKEQTNQHVSSGMSVRGRIRGEVTKSVGITNKVYRQIPNSDFLLS